MTLSGTKEEREQLIFDPWQPDYFFTHKLLPFLSNMPTQVIISHKIIHKGGWESKKLK